jgi:hypothetical protein
MQPDQNQPVPPSPNPTPPSPFGPPIAPLSSDSVAPPSAPTPPPPVKAPKSKKPLIIILVVVLLLAAGAAAAYFLLMPKPATNNTVNTNTSQDATIVATSGGDLEQVCNNKKISNAVAPNKPYVIAPHINTNNTWAIFPITGNDEHYSLNLEEANVVACLVSDTSTASTPQTCEVTNFETKEKFTIQYAGISYNVTFYAAQTGEKLGEGVVSAAGDTCPVYAEQAGTVYAIPTSQEATEVFEAFISKNA